MFSGIFPGFRRKRPKPPRALCRNCPHPCVSCDYYNRVFALTDSASLRSACDEVKSHHVVRCMTGHPESSSCTEAA